MDNEKDTKENSPKLEKALKAVETYGGDDKDNACKEYVITYQDKQTCIKVNSDIKDD